jgi:uncharacterized membrane protein YebE (DUF533 family)
MLKAIIIGTALFTVTASSAFAGTPGINAREKNQLKHIVGGVSTGELTARETAKLLQGQVRIQKMEVAAKADGHVGVFERLAITGAQAVQGVRIYAKKHN